MDVFPLDKINKTQYNPFLYFLYYCSIEYLYRTQKDRVLTLCILRHNVTYHHLDGQNITLEHTCLCKTDGKCGKRYLILKMNYEINMHPIDFKTAHINVQALVYLVLFQK